MTREEILAMEPGRELDWEIWVQVFENTGWSWDGLQKCVAFYRDETGYPLSAKSVPKYSTNISAAWEVTRKVGFYLEIEGHHHTGWKVTLGHEFSASEWELPLAICKASLLAVMDT